VQNLSLRSRNSYQELLFLIALETLIKGFDVQDFPDASPTEAFKNQLFFYAS